MSNRLMALIAGLLLFASLAGAQTKYYKLDFVVKEMEGAKVLSTNNYTMSVSNVGNSSLRTGGRVAVTSGNSSNLFDVGFNVELRNFSETENRMVASMTIDLTMLDLGSTDNKYPAQNKWNGTVLLTAKKPALVFAVDSPGARRSVQLEVTATPLL